MWLNSDAVRVALYRGKEAATLCASVSDRATCEMNHRHIDVELVLMEDLANELVDFIQEARVASARYFAGAGVSDENS